MPNKNSVSNDRYKWAAAGDVNAFFGLMLDNIAGLVLAVTLLTAVFQFPVNFAMAYMVPGTAIGVFVGDLLYFWLAFRLARKTGRSDVTAMPLGLDTPSTIGMVLFVLGPAYKAALGSGMEEVAAATQAWHIGICAIVMTGLIKAVFAVGSDWIRRVIPRAGLLGSLAAIALVLIAFNQMPEIAANSIVGFASLVIVFVTLIARGRLPFNVPGAAGAVLVGCLIWYALQGIEALRGTPIPGPDMAKAIWFPTEWFTVFSFEWARSFDMAFGYLPYIVPFAITTVIGGIDCTESAASAGDEYDTRQIIGIEAIATILAGLCGGVVQTTPYIGHPAYKFMGGRAAYTLATALFVGGAGVIGYFSFMFQLIPKAALLPILIFIGIEITAQSFHATPRRHYAALAIACMAALAKLVMIILGRFFDVIDYSKVPAEVAAGLQELVLFLSVLAGGFILTSLIWASAVAKIIDRRFNHAAIFFLIAGVFTLFGIIHSPLPGDKMFWPSAIMDFEPNARKIVIEFSIAYGVMAAILVGLGWYMKDELAPIDSDEEFEKLA